MSKDEEKRKFTIREERPAAKQISAELADFHTRVYFADEAAKPPNHPRVEFVTLDGSVRKDVKLSDALGDDDTGVRDLLELLNRALEGTFGG